MLRVRNLAALLGITLCLILSAASSPAAGFRLEAATAVDAWDEDGGGEDGSGSAASQYLSARMTQGWGSIRLSLDAYGRATAALRDSDADKGESRLYTLALTASIEDALSVALGRQEIAPATGPVYLDGLRVRAGAGRLQLLGRWGLLADLDDREDRSDRHLGLGLAADLAEGMDLALDYARTYGDGRLLSELLAADWTYSWFRFTNSRVLFNYDLMSETLHDTLIGSRLFFSDSFTLEVEYSQKVQSFDSDSIYSVFAVDAPETTSFSLLFTPSRTVRYVWEYALESYGEGSGGRRYGVSGAWAPGASRLEAGIYQHKGYGGYLSEVTAEASFRLAHTLDLKFGGEITRSRNDDESENVSAYVARLGAQWAPLPRALLTLALEQSNDDASEAGERSGRLTFSTEF